MVASKQQVVVGYDASDDSDRGLEWAMSYARERNLTLNVFAASGDREDLPERTEDGPDTVVGQWLDRAAERLRDSGVQDFVLTTGTGPAVPDLLEASKTAALLVVGAQGHGSVGGMVLGSVSQHLTRHASCPVVVVRGTAPPAGARVVVGIDGSDVSRHALEFAFDYASWSGRPLSLVHGQAVTAMNGLFDVEVSPEVGEVMSKASRLLSEAVAGLAEKYPDVAVTLEPVPLPPIRALADASANAALVVVGSRGRGGFVGLLLGSVSSTVLTHAECSVAVVR